MSLFLPPRNDSYSGMMLGAGAFGLLTAVDTVFKLLVIKGHPPSQILFYNAIFALTVILLWAMRTGGLMRLQTAHPIQHLVRASTAVLSAFSAVYAYSRLPLTDFYAIVFVGPLAVTLLSAFWLNEVVDRARWVAIVIGFTGVMVIANPFEGDVTAQSGALMLGRLSAFISVFCYALSVIMIRRMRLRESSLSFSFYGYLSSLLIAGFLMFLRNAPPFTLGDIAHIALSGTLAGASTLCMMSAYHRTPVALVAPFQYTQIIWGMIAGYVLWDQLPTLRLLVGAMIVAGSGFYVIRQEMRGGVSSPAKQAGQ